MKNQYRFRQSFAALLLGSGIVLGSGIAFPSYAEGEVTAIWPEKSSPVGSQSMGLYGQYAEPGVTYNVKVIDPNGNAMLNPPVVANSRGDIEGTVSANDIVGTYQVFLENPSGQIVAETSFWFNFIGM